MPPAPGLAKLKNKTSAKFTEDIELKSIVSRYHQGQIKAAARVNQELLAFYWSLGKDIVADVC